MNRHYFHTSLKFFFPTSISLPVRKLVLSAVCTVSALLADARSILDIQSFKTEQGLALAEGHRATILNLNPFVNSWFVVTVDAGPLRGTYHLEVTDPSTTDIQFESRGILITSNSSRVLCPVFEIKDADNLQKMSARRQRFQSLCGSSVLLRRGDGEVQVPQNIAEAFFNESRRRRDKLSSLPQSQGPSPARVADRGLNPIPSNIALDEGTTVIPGSWRRARHHSGVFVSLIHPRQVDRAILDDGLADPLAQSELDTRVALVAIDIDKHRWGWSHGPILPGIGSWTQMHPFQSAPDGPGPEGFNSFSPISATTGVLNPHHLPNLVGVMCGGFQRWHGRMRAQGPLAGLHYGFMQEGVVLSKLNKGLITFVIDNDGRPTIKVWDDSDEANIAKIRYARQNGVPIVHEDRGRIIPNPVVKRDIRFGGNWSGSGDGNYQSSRSAACIAQNGSANFIIYAYFPSATPNAMARVFQAYGCKTAIHLDMNNPMWAYFALLSQNEGGEFLVEHADRNMQPKDNTVTIGGRQVTLPRFVGRPDMVNPGDFFYILKRE